MLSICLAVSLSWAAALPSTSKDPSQQNMVCMPSCSSSAPQLSLISSPESRAIPRTHALRRGPALLATPYGIGGHLPPAPRLLPPKRSFGTSDLARPTCLYPLSPAIAFSHTFGSASTASEPAPLPLHSHCRSPARAAPYSALVLQCLHTRSPAEAQQQLLASTIQPALRCWRAQWGRAAPLCLNAQRKCMIYAPIAQCCQVRHRRSAPTHGSQRTRSLSMPPPPLPASGPRPLARPPIHFPPRIYAELSVIRPPPSIHLPSRTLPAFSASRRSEPGVQTPSWEHRRCVTPVSGVCARTISLYALPQPHSRAGDLRLRMRHVRAGRASPCSPPGRRGRRMCVHTYVARRGWRPEGARGTPVLKLEGLYGWSLDSWRLARAVFLGVRHARALTGRPAQPQVVRLFCFFPALESRPHLPSA